MYQRNKIWFEVNRHGAPDWKSLGFHNHYTLYQSLVYGNASFLAPPNRKKVIDYVGSRKAQILEAGVFELAFGPEHAAFDLRSIEDNKSKLLHVLESIRLGVELHAPGVLYGFYGKPEGIDDETFDAYQDIADKQTAAFPAMYILNKDGIEDIESMLWRIRQWKRISDIPVFAHLGTRYHHLVKGLSLKELPYEVALRQYKAIINEPGVDGIVLWDKSGKEFSESHGWWTALMEVVEPQA